MKQFFQYHHSTYFLVILFDLICISVILRVSTKEEFYMKSKVVAWIAFALAIFFLLLIRVSDSSLIIYLFWASVVVASVAAVGAWYQKTKTK